MIHTQNS